VAPVLFPKNVCALALDSVNDRAGVLVEVATLVLNKGVKLPELKLLTVPVPEKVWPDAKVITPVLAIDSPVLAGVHGAALQNSKSHLGDVPSRARIRKRWTLLPEFTASMSNGKEFFEDPGADGGIIKPPELDAVLPKTF
jgi:hypothetical protein